MTACILSKRLGAHPGTMERRNRGRPIVAALMRDLRFEGDIVQSR